MSRELTVIKCPICGREYLPAEIFLPKEFFGKPEIIKRDAEGKIVDFIGTSLNTDETYCCDNCGKVFNVAATIQFESYAVEGIDLTSDYVTNVSSRFKLKEY